jgi:hypothetical protein
MPPIRSLVFKHCTYIVALILLLSEIMPTYLRYVEKKLVYIIIAAPFSRQPSSYFKYTKLNMRSFYNIRLVFIDKCTCLTIYLYAL